ncbi:MAG: hypothetical protein A2284_15435 [Deltaproteobacteria bacterium RIFOXYA12_FULL_61_11]|nr:MAG: hypothetical protein A2284_15435 [Deltaproteobacteria bacterium RIFOXYA12_FULL_61_11]
MYYLLPSLLLLFTALTATAEEPTDELGQLLEEELALAREILHSENLLEIQEGVTLQERVEQLEQTRTKLKRTTINTTSVFRSETEASRAEHQLAIVHIARSILAAEIREPLFLKCKLNREGLDFSLKFPKKTKLLYGSGRIVMYFTDELAAYTLTGSLEGPIVMKVSLLQEVKDMAAARVRTSARHESKLVRDILLVKELDEAHSSASTRSRTYLDQFILRLQEAQEALASDLAELR